MVGNGEQLDYDKMCSNIPIILNTTTFFDFYDLPISGAGVVLTTLGPILTDLCQINNVIHT